MLPRELFDLTGRTAVITGAGGSLGRAIAVGLAHAGADVALLDTAEGPLEETRTEAAAAGRTAVAHVVDVADEAEVDDALAAIVDRLGTPRILVNNAAAPVHRERPEQFPLAAWERSIAVNLTGYFLCARAVGRRMIEAHAPGSIVNISSIAGLTALGRGNFAYSVSKGGVNQLTRELAIEWAQHGIRVNAILPAQFHNSEWDRALADPTRAGTVERVLAGIPLGRLGEAREMVGPVLFLVSDAAAMITGTTLPVDGGNLALNAGGSVSW